MLLVAEDGLEVRDENNPSNEDGPIELGKFYNTTLGSRKETLV